MSELRDDLVGYPVRCPLCQHLAQVPEFLFGQRVQCPNCMGFYLAPQRRSDGTLTAPQALSRWFNKPLFFPGMFLLVIGLLTVGVNTLMLAMIDGQPEQLQEGFRQGMLKLLGDEIALQKENQQLTQELAKEFLQQVRTPTLVTLGVGMVTCCGGISILTTRFWAIAMLGAIGAVVNIGWGCCFGGTPVGVWCLVLLLHPEIRRSFR